MSELVLADGTHMVETVGPVEGGEKGDAYRVEGAAGHVLGIPADCPVHPEGRRDMREVYADEMDADAEPTERDLPSDELARWWRDQGGDVDATGDVEERVAELEAEL